MRYKVNGQMVKYPTLLVVEVINKTTISILVELMATLVK